MRRSHTDTQLALIRAEIQRYGQSIVPCEQLLALVPTHDPIGVQFSHIFAIAAREHWSFEFRNDGTVRFANLKRPVELTLPWLGQELAHAAAC